MAHKSSGPNHFIVICRQIIDLETPDGEGNAASATASSS
jgi:hypothetical protein